MPPQIVRTGPLLETQGVQNSSFELQCALFTLLDEEKAIGLKISVFRPSSLFPLPVEETARKTSKTRVLEHAIAFFPLPVEEKGPRAKNLVKSRGGSGEGPEARPAKREPCLKTLPGKDLTGINRARPPAAGSLCL